MAENSKRLSIDLYARWPVPTQEPPRVTSLEQRTFLTPRNSKGFGVSVSETRVKGQILEQKVPRYSYHLRTSKGFRVPGSGGRDQYIFFSVISQDIYTHTQTSSLFCFSALSYFPVIDTWSQVLKMSFKLGKENCTCPFLSALQDSGMGRSLDTPGPTPSHLCGLLGVSFMYQHVWLVRPKKPRFLSRTSRRILAQESRSSPESFPGGSESVHASLSWTSRPEMVQFLLAR